MTTAFGNLSREECSRLTLSYDNMCHLDNLRVAKEPLPLPGTLAVYTRNPEVNINKQEYFVHMLITLTFQIKLCI